MLNRTKIAQHQKGLAITLMKIYLKVVGKILSTVKTLAARYTKHLAKDFFECIVKHTFSHKILEAPNIDVLKGHYLFGPDSLPM